nr:hypothetical protein [Spirosoma foliorum]
MSVDQYKKEVGLMNLEKLIEKREGVSDTTFPIPDKELLQRFEQLYTGAVNDVMREFCLLNQALPGHILPLREYRTVAGFAFTVKSAPNAMIRGEMEFRTQMLEEMHEDAFIVWDTTNDSKATLWGGRYDGNGQRQEGESGLHRWGYSRYAPDSGSRTTGIL